MFEQRLRWCEQHNISVALLIFLFASEFLSHYLFWGVLLVGTAYYIIEERGKLFVRDPRSTVVFFLLCIVGLMGSFISMFLNAYSGGMWVFLRDLIRISAVPLTFYLSGQLLKNKSSYVLYTTLYFFCSVYGIGSMLLAIPRYAMASGSLFAFSDNLVDQWVTAVGVFLAFFKSSEIKEYYIACDFIFANSIFDFDLFEYPVYKKIFWHDFEKCGYACTGRSCDMEYLSGNITYVYDKNPEFTCGDFVQ